MSNLSVVLNPYKVVNVFYVYFYDEGVWMDLDGSGYLLP